MANSNLFSLVPLLGGNEQIKTRSGVVFNPCLDLWDYQDGVVIVRLDFTRLPVSSDLKLVIKRVLTWYASNKSPGYLKNIFTYLLRFLRFNYASQQKIISHISVEMILNFRGSLNKSQQYLLGYIKAFFLKWNDMREPCLDADVGSLLEEMKLKGNKKGTRVLTMDPEKGPLSDIEFEAVHVALASAYESSRIDLVDYLLGWVVIALGQRPIQYAALKVSDFYVSLIDGEEVFFLRIPRAKQRGVNLRELFSDRRLLPDIGSLFVEHISRVITEFEPTGYKKEDLPLFPKPLKESLPFLPGFRLSNNNTFDFHYTTQEFGVAFQKIIFTLGVFSERTGKRLNASVYRFRYTYATRMATEGYRELVIAENLDHSDTQNIMPYVQCSTGMQERIDQALALQFAPYAQAFTGTIIEDESEARRSGDLSSRIFDPRLGLEITIGNCGNFSFCGQFAPIACYTCRAFQPWLKGPHEEVLEELLCERERLLKRGDKRIAATFDRTILAVAEVVRQCEEILGGVGE